MTEKINLKAIKTNTGFYLTDLTNISDRYTSSYLKYYLINDAKPEQSFDQSWYWVLGNEIYSIKKEIRAQEVNRRFELIDPTLQSDKIPQMFIEDNVIDRDDDCDWKDEFKHLKSLYKLKWDTLPVTFEELEFNLDIILTLDIDKIIEPEKLFYRGEYNSSLDGYKGGYPLLKAEPNHPLLSKIIYPQIVYQYVESKYTSKQVYEILRNYIKTNIDNKVAKVTSDYNFCFTVEKIISIAEPHSWQKEILTARGKSYHPAKFQKRYVSDRKIKIFEMTHAEENYKGYTAIPSLIAATEIELVEKMKEWCENVIKEINQPLEDCPHCNGMGVRIKE